MLLYTVHERDSFEKLNSPLDSGDFGIETCIDQWNPLTSLTQRYLGKNQTELLFVIYIENIYWGINQECQIPLWGLNDIDALG